VETIDTLMDTCNELTLRLSTTQRELERAKRVVTQLHDMLVEYAAPYTTSKRNRAMFEDHLDACLAAAAPFINDTARRVLVGTLNDFNGQQLLIEVLPTGEFHIACREAEWMSWSAGQWGWLR